jgi:hypothetical protein
MFEVIHGKYASTKPAQCTVWVDRRSALGNPFPMKDKNDMIERVGVIAEYRNWLWKKIKGKDAKVIKALKELIELEREHGKVYLMCWCKPLPCHADVLVNALNWMKTQGENNEDR